MPAVRWLALRLDRRKALPASSVKYEDDIEFLEGLADYASYRLFEVLERMTPPDQLWWMQGFPGIWSLEGGAGPYAQEHRAR